MTQSFDEWFTTYRPSLDTSAIEAEFIFEAGAQSKQAEIDELNKQLSEIKDKYILRGQEIDLLNRKIYDKDQIIEACLYLDDEETANEQ